MTVETESRITNPARMRQLIDFGGLTIDGEVYPTDIDGLIEYKDSEYIIFEVKYRDISVPYGQRLALQRMVDDFSRAGKRAIAVVCEHKVRDRTKPVIAARCRVREFYSSDAREWTTPETETTVKNILNERKNRSTKGGDDNG